MTTKAQALALYAIAQQTGDFAQAAHAMALALAPKPSAAAKALDLSAPVPRPTKSATVAGVICEWSDGSTTLQRVAFNKPAHLWASAFQACDRLRRMRARHAWADELGAGSLERPGPAWHAPLMGVRRETADWWAYCRARPMPHLVAMMCEETGETFEPVGTFGAGDAALAGEILARIFGEPLAVAA